MALLLLIVLSFVYHVTLFVVFFINSLNDFDVILTWQQWL